MSTRGQREAARSQAHVLEGRVRKWEKKWMPGADKSKCNVYKWVVASDPETGKDVESSANERAALYVPVRMQEVSLKGSEGAVAAAVAAAMAPAAAAAEEGPSRRSSRR